METIDAPPQCVSQGRQLHPGSGAQSWPWGCGGAPHQGGQPRPPPLQRDRNFCRGSLALRGGDWCHGTPFPHGLVPCSGSTEERMKRPFQTRDPSDRKKTFTPASDEPHKNGSRSAEEQRETSAQPWQKHICQQDKGLKEGRGHKTSIVHAPPSFVLFWLLGPSSDHQG